MVDLRLIDLTPPSDEAMKPSELIRISGHEGLSLVARRAITILWHNAHKQGIEQGKDYTIELAALKTDSHKGTELIEDAILALMQTVLMAKMPDGRTRRVQFLGGNDLDDPSRPSGIFRYSFDRRLVEILQDSHVWGRIAIPVLMAFSTRYAVSLYENTCQWFGLTHKTSQELSLDEFRLLLGVEEGKYERFGWLNKHVITPAVTEIVALAPYNIAITPIKQARSVTRVLISWWPKNETELKEAFAETQRSKVGRKARIAGKIERIVPQRNPEALARDERRARKRASAELLEPPALLAEDFHADDLVRIEIEDLQRRS